MPLILHQSSLDLPFSGNAKVALQRDLQSGTARRCADLRRSGLPGKPGRRRPRTCEDPKCPGSLLFRLRINAFRNHSERNQLFGFCICYFRLCANDFRARAFHPARFVFLHPSSARRLNRTHASRLG